MKASQFSEVSQVSTAPEHTLVLIGTALDGPAQTPFSLEEGNDVYELLGQSPLADAYNAAARTGVENIVLYRLNGMHAESALLSPEGEELLRFRSLCASEIYNQIQLMVYPTHLYVVGTEGRTRSYFFDRYNTSDELAYAINLDAFYGLLEFNARLVREDYPLAGVVQEPIEIMFSGGEDEDHLIHSRHPQGEAPTDGDTIVPVLKTRLEHALFGESPEDILDRQPNSHLGSLNCGVFTLCDMFHDEDPELTELFGSFCMNKTKYAGVGAIGVIGLKPVYPEELDAGEEMPFAASVKLRVQELIALSHGLDDREAYRYVQVVAGGTTYPESDKSWTSLAYSYAATQVQMPYYTMMANKAMTGFGKLTIEFRKEDIALLTANGYICIVPSVRRGFVPYSVSSFSKDRQSGLAKPHNLRITQFVSQGITEEMDQLIGEGYTKLSLGVALTKVDEFLTDLVATGVIKEYTLEHQVLDNGTALNLDVALTPLSEITAIQSVVTIDFPRGVIA